MSKCLAQSRNSVVARAGSGFLPQGPALPMSLLDKTGSLPQSPGFCFLVSFPDSCFLYAVSNGKFLLYRDILESYVSKIDILIQGTISVMIRRTWRKTGLPWWLMWLSICLPMQEILVPSLGCEDPLEKGMATHSSILAWIIPWTEEACGPPSMESQRAGHGWVTEHKGKEGLLVSKKKKSDCFHPENNHSIFKQVVHLSSPSIIHAFSFLRK